MSNALTLTQSIVSGTIGKSGKVSARAANVARIINSQDIHGVATLAIVGKGAIQRKAAEALKVQGLDHYLALPELSGREWSIVHGLLAGEFGIVPPILATTAPERIKQLLDIDATKRASWLLERANLVTDAEEKRIIKAEKRHAEVTEALTRWSLARQASIEAQKAQDTAPTA